MPVLATTKHIPILMYHSIAQRATRGFRQFIVPPALFAEQVAYLHQRGYTPLTVTQYVTTRAQGRNLPTRPVILTFDDGFADFYTEAFPVLQRHGFVATLYIATAFVNGTSRWLRREGEGARLMVTWEQLQEMSAYGIECGAHSHNHPQLDTLAQHITREEIMQSKMVLEQRLGHAVWSFAYPFGYYTTRIKQQVKEAGYTSACAVKHAMSNETTDPFALRRLIVTRHTSIAALEALLTGQGILTPELLCRRMLTPLWQVIRRGSASVARTLKEGYAMR